MNRRRRLSARPRARHYHRRARQGKQAQRGLVGQRLGAWDSAHLRRRTTLGSCLKGQMWGTAARQSPCACLLACLLANCLEDVVRRRSVGWAWRRSRQRDARVHVRRAASATYDAILSTQVFQGFMHPSSMQGLLVVISILRRARPQQHAPSVQSSSAQFINTQGQHVTSSSAAGQHCAYRSTLINLQGAGGPGH